MTDFRAELQLLFDDAESFAEASLGHHYLWVAALNRAHAALAEQPVEPTRKEAVDLYSEVMAAHDCQTLGEMAEHFARAVLARWGQSLAILDDCSDRLDGAHENTIRKTLEGIN
jgi:hypothetical protein